MLVAWFLADHSGRSFREFGIGPVRDSSCEFVVKTFVEGSVMSKLLQSGIDGPVLVVLALLAGCGASGPTENDVVLAQKRLARAAGHDYKEIEVSNLKCNQVGEAWGSVSMLEGSSW
jgi:hypothetical protein